MDDSFTTERAAQFRRGQDARRRQIAAERAQLAAAALGAIDREQQQRRLAAAHRLANPIKPRHRDPGAAGKAERVAAALRQQGLDAVGETRRGCDRPPRRASKDPLGQCPVHYIALRRQPQTPPRQARGDIRDQHPVRRDDKAQQSAAILALPGDDAAALRRAGCGSFRGGGHPMRCRAVRRATPSPPKPAPAHRTNGRRRGLP